VWQARRACAQAPEVDGETRVRGVPPSARVGDFVRVAITDGKGYDLEAKAVKG
jgi:hypothetical protein